MEDFNEIMEFIVEDAIIPDLKSTEKKEVINEMVDALKEANSIDNGEVKDILRALNKKEELGSTGIGKGVLPYRILNMLPLKK